MSVQSFIKIQLRFLLLLAACVSFSVLAETFQLGDLAPRGAPDGQLNAADSLILQRIILGDIAPTDDEKIIGDVAPLGAPNGTLNAGDLLVQQRAILGAVTLGTVSILPLPPTLDPVVSPTNTNPYLLTGSASPGNNVTVYVEGVSVGSTTADMITGEYEILLALAEGENTIYAIADDGVDYSPPSSNVIIDFQYIDGGVLPADVSGLILLENTRYSITGNIMLASGQALTIQAGVKLEFDDATKFRVYGELRISGTEINPVVLTSSSLNPTAGVWRGIILSNGASNSVIDNAIIEWSSFGVQINSGVSNANVINSVIKSIRVGIEVNTGATNALIDNVLIENAYRGVVSWGSSNTVIANSRIYNINQEGILFDRADGAIIDNTIDAAGTAISLYSASPYISSNTLSNSGHGIYMIATSAVVSPQIKTNLIIGNTTGIDIQTNFNDANPIIDSGNIITNNNVGIRFSRYVGTGRPNPMINNNEIHSNTEANIQAGYGTNIIDATGNWWGTTVVSHIAESINDTTDSKSLRTIDYSGFLDAANGSPVPGNFLPPIISLSTTLAAGLSYQALGDVYVEPGVTLTIEAGVEILLGASMGLIVDGTLQVNGTLLNPVVFTSSNPEVSPGDWQGIVLNTLSSNTVIDGAIIEFAIIGVEITASGNDSLISNSLLQNNEINGIYFNRAGGIARNNVLREHAVNTSASGIRIENASPLIEDNAIHDNSRGIYIYKHGGSSLEAAPQIRHNNINNNSEGIYAGNSTATISGNVISNNSSYGIRILGGEPTINLANIITNNQIGIGLDQGTTAIIDGNSIIANVTGVFISGRSYGALLQPVITNNDIYNNTNQNLYLSRVPGTTAFNISNNWWGTDVILDIRATMRGFRSDLNALVLLDAVSTTSNIIDAVPFSVIISENYISPETSPGIKDVTHFSSTLTRYASWNVKIVDQAQQLIKNYAGTGVNISVDWDGKNEALNSVIDGVYSFVLTVGSVTVNSYLHVDNTMPVATMISPLVDQIVTSTTILNIVGIVFDETYHRHQIDIADGLFPVEADYQNLHTETGTNGTKGSLQVETLHSWLYNNINGMQEQGDKSLRLMVSDKAGNTSITVVQFSLDYITITNVTNSTDSIVPGVGDSVDITFTVNKPSTVTLKIYPELEYGLGIGESLVRHIRNVYASAGTYTINWDGKYASGQVVPQDAYRYEIEADDGVQANKYAGPVITLTPYSPRPPNISLNDVVFSQNKYAKVFSTVPAGKILRHFINIASGVVATKSEVVDEGDYLFLIDGRTAEGKYVDGNLFVTGGSNYYELSPNAIFVKNKAPQLLGTEAYPNIEIKSDPYLVMHSYDQSSRVEFTVDEDSYVTVHLLNACPSSNTECSMDPAVATVKTLINNDSVAMAEIVSFEWRGYDFEIADTDTNNILVGEEGVFTYLITATSVATGNVTTYRGALQLYH